MIALKIEIEISQYPLAYKLVRSLRIYIKNYIINKRRKNVETNKN